MATMALGGVLIIIGLPLLFGYYNSGKKNIMWRNLGLIPIALGLIIIVVGLLLYFITN
jgi:hypothetical protein